MDILGVGPLELILVLIIALLVFGPERLPEIAARAGRTVRQLREISQAFSEEFQREVAQAKEFREAAENLKKEVDELRQEAGSLRGQLEAPLEEAAREARASPGEEPGASQAASRREEPGASQAASRREEPGADQAASRREEPGVDKAASRREEATGQAQPDEDPSEEPGGDRPEPEPPIEEDRDRS